jgi:flagellar motor switch protein FliM
MIQAQLEKVLVPVHIVLGENTITVAELLELDVGDVLVLDRKTDDNIKIIVGNNLKYYGKPGIVNTRLAVQIHEIVEEGIEDE